MAKLQMKWVKSGIGHPEDQRGTLRALGFHRLNQVVVHEDTASIRGMLAKVSHLVKSEVVDNGKE